MSSSHYNSPDIDAATLLSRLNRGEPLTLLDVREPIEFYTRNIGGINIPLGQLQTDIKFLNIAKNEEIIVLCKMGLRSETAQSLLREMGYTQVKNLEGGLLAVQRLEHKK